MKKVMMMAAIVFAVSMSNVFGQAHGHLNIGAVGAGQGDQLDFDNGNIFATNTGFVQTLLFTNAGTYAGYYKGNITLTGLAATSQFGGPVPGAAAVGSTIYAQIVSVEGPAGGQFGFWDVGATNPTISMLSGTTGTNMYKVSENNGAPGTDPYGHIHGRQFTATKPGIYLVGFKAFDRSTNGSGGGPIHSPSDVLTFYFQAGVSIATIANGGGQANITFGAPANKTCTLEFTDSLSITNWTDSGVSVTGADAFQSLIDASAIGTQRFYRIRTQ